MENEDFQDFKETAWRRPLTSGEKAALQKFLATHPESQQGWAEEAALSQLLERLPAAPQVSSNFTARLMQAVQQTPPRSRWREWFEPAGWLPESFSGKVAMCSMMVCLGLLSFREYQVMHRVRLARNLAGVSQVATLPRMEWLKDFDTINGISQVKVADDDLLVALQ